MQIFGQGISLQGDGRSGQGNKSVALRQFNRLLLLARRPEDGDPLRGETSASRTTSPTTSMAGDWTFSSFALSAISPRVPEISL
ncbi:hypothetical protein [Methanothrix soehngenii]|uniref:hypothetical protein n=1 Tax=Methanothrix soehngenii TaxID=2223 RepID=UPI00300DA93D